MLTSCGAASTSSGSPITNRPAGISSIVALEPVVDELTVGPLLVAALEGFEFWLSEEAGSQPDSKPSNKTTPKQSLRQREALRNAPSSVVGPNLISIGVAEALSGLCPQFLSHKHCVRIVDAAVAGFLGELSHDHVTSGQHIILRASHRAPFLEQIH